MSDCRQLEFIVLQGKALLCQFACFLVQVLGGKNFILDPLCFMWMLRSCYFS